MENEEVKAYLIKFVKKTLNKCDVFTKVYGKKFITERLEKNSDKVITNIYSNSIGGCYQRIDKTITIFSNDENAKRLTVKDIERNWELQQIILHEAIHAIFNRTREECEEFGIKSGTGIEEEYKDSKILGRGLNEGLTEWISEKAGYEAQAYKAETNIIRILELAIGEEAVMKLAKGNIRGNVAEMLKMSEYQCVSILANIDDICLKEENVNAIKSIIQILKNTEHKKELEKQLGDYYETYLELMNTEKENDISSQLEYLDRVLADEEDGLDKIIIYAEERLFLKYFKDEITKMQNSEVITKEEFRKITKLYNNISSKGEQIKPEIADSVLVLKFKNEIYEQLITKYKPTILERMFGENQFLPKKCNLPEVKPNGWFQKINQEIRKNFKKKNSDNIIIDDKRQSFKEQISNMSNYSENIKNESMTLMKDDEKEL